jgi:hypothetical protein
VQERNLEARALSRKRASGCDIRELLLLLLLLLWKIKEMKRKNATLTMSTKAF